MSAQTELKPYIGNKRCSYCDKKAHWKLESKNLYLCNKHVVYHAKDSITRINLKGGFLPPF